MKNIFIIALFLFTLATTVNAGTLYTSNFYGIDIGERINNALLSSDRCTVSVDETGRLEYSTTILFNSDKTILFDSSDLVYTGTEHAISSANISLTEPNTPISGNAVKNAVIKDLTLSVTGICLSPINLTGVRSSFFQNWRISKDDSACTKNKSMVQLIGGNSNSLSGPGGCHLNVFDTIRMYGKGNIDFGLRVRSEGTQSCNANTFNNIYVCNSNKVGIAQENGVGNVYTHPTLEWIGGKGTTTGTGIRVRGKCTDIISPYMENCQYGIDLRRYDNPSQLINLLKNSGYMRVANKYRL